MVDRSCFAVCTERSASGQEPTVTLTPALVEAGSPELIRVDAPADAHVSGEWMGHALEFFRGREKQAWFALGGVDVEAATGPSTLRITVRVAQGGPIEVTRPVEVHPGHYRTGALTVAPKFVEPPPEAQKEIEAESHLKADVFAKSADEALWTSSFREPVKAEPTDSFGTRRMFNGKLASVHKGMDFRAADGNAGARGRTAESWCWRGRSTLKATAW